MTDILTIIVMFGLTAFCWWVVCDSFWYGKWGLFFVYLVLALFVSSLTYDRITEPLRSSARAMCITTLVVDQGALEVRDAHIVVETIKVRCE